MAAGVATTVVVSHIGLHKLVAEKKAALYTVAFGVGGSGVQVKTGFNVIEAAFVGLNTATPGDIGDVPVAVLNSSDGNPGTANGSVWVQPGDNASTKALDVSVLVFGR